MATKGEDMTTHPHDTGDAKGGEVATGTQTDAGGGGLPKLTGAEFERRIREIARIAKVQAEGPYTPQSDAVQSLMLIETLAMLLIESWQAQGR